MQRDRKVAWLSGSQLVRLDDLHVSGVKRFDYTSGDVREGLTYKSGDFHSSVAFGRFRSPDRNMRETHWL